MKYHYKNKRYYDDSYSNYRNIISYSHLHHHSTNERHSFSKYSYYHHHPYSSKYSTDSYDSYYKKSSRYSRYSAKSSCSQSSSFRRHSEKNHYEYAIGEIIDRYKVKLNKIFIKNFPTISTTVETLFRRWYIWSSIRMRGYS